MSDYLFTAKYFNEEFIIEKYVIINETSEVFITMAENGRTVMIPNEIEQIAFCERNAILVLINSYNKRIADEPDLLFDLLFQQRQIQNAFDQSIYIKIPTL